jgi:hypothetical protein
MSVVRFLTLAVAIFALVFGVQRVLAVRSLSPDARSTAAQTADDSTEELEATSFASDGDAVRDRLRYAVLDAAMDFARTPCDVALKAVYIKAAINYTRAWHRATGCKSFTSCNASGAQFDRAAATFESPLDRRVQEAMSRANSAGVLGYDDFPEGAGRWVALMAGAPLGPAGKAETGEGPRCYASVER